DRLARREQQGQADGREGRPLREVAPPARAGRLRALAGWLIAQRGLNATAQGVPRSRPAGTSRRACAPSLPPDSRASYTSAWQPPDSETPEAPCSTAPRPRLAPLRAADCFGCA